MRLRKNLPLGEGEHSIRLYADAPRRAVARTHYDGQQPTPTIYEGVDTTKTERFNLRLTTAEKDRIADRAKSANRPMSEYMIDMALHRKITVIDGLPQLTGQLKSIGNNLNQLTLLANMGKVQTVCLQETYEKLGDIYLKICKLTEVL